MEQVGTTVPMKEPRCFSMAYCSLRRYCKLLIIIQLVELAHGSGPFDRPDSNHSTFTEEAHLARIISVLGPPPVDMLLEAKYASRYFDTEGSYVSRLAMLKLY